MVYVHVQQACVICTWYDFGTCSDKENTTQFLIHFDNS